MQLPDTQAQPICYSVKEAQTQPDFSKVLGCSYKKPASCFGRCKMASVRGVKQPSRDATQEKCWTHFPPWSRPRHRWTRPCVQGLAVTASHSHHLPGFNKWAGCRSVSEGALQTWATLADETCRHPARVSWVACVHLSSPSHWKDGSRRKIGLQTSFCGVGS